MSFSKEKRQETLIYLVLWGILFIAPVMGMYIRTMNISSQTFDWSEVLMVWRQLAIYFAIFLIHNHLLAPMLVYRQRRWLYCSIVAVLLICFAAYQCSNRPSGKGRPDIPWHNELSDNKKPPFHKFDNHRPPEFDADHMPPPDFDQKRAYDRRPPMEKNGKSMRPPIIFGQRDIIASIVLILMMAANLGIKLFFKQQCDQKHMAELEHQNLEQQLEYLKYQINPHFLMNTLNNIHALVDIDAEKAKDTIVELSKMLRFVLYDGAKQSVPLSHELAFLEEYIKLMRLRYTDKVRVTLNKPDTIPQAEVPPLLFITFVENAFKHGVSYRQDSFIEVNLDLDGNPDIHTPVFLHFTCRNSKKPDHEDKHGGVGLRNVRQRLDLIYEDQYTLKTDDQADTYQIELSIPIKT